MKEYTEVFREYAQGKRECSKEVFKLARRIWRGINTERFTFEDIYIPYNGGVTNANNN